MAVKRIFDLEQSINPKYNPRANFAPIGDNLQAPFNDFTGVVHDGGLHPLHKLTRSSSENVKTMSDDDRLIELKSENVSYPQILERNTSFDKGTTAAAGFGVYYLNSTWILLEKGTLNYYTSTDGIVWSARTLPAISKGFSYGYKSICFDGTNYCFVTCDYDVVDYFHYVTYTTDFVSHTKKLIAHVGVTTIHDYSIDYGGGYYNYVFDDDNANGATYYSTDLTTWTIGYKTEGYGGAGGDRVNPGKIKYLNGKFWLIRFTDQTFTAASVFQHSDNGSGAWTQETCAISDIQSFTYANGKFIAVGQTGGTTDTAYSTTGLTADWAAGGTLTIGHDWIGNIVWTGTYYMAFGSDLSTANSTAIYSADGNTWTALSLPYSRKWSGAAYVSNTIIVGSVEAQHLKITLSAGGSRTESIYRAYISGYKTGEEMLKYGIATANRVSKYQDIKYGSTKVYAAHIVGDTVEIDEVNADTIAVSTAAASTVTANQVRNCFFLRDLSASDNKHIGFNTGGNTYIYTARLSAAVAVVFTGGYYLSGGSGTTYVLLCNDIVSNAHTTVPSAKYVRTYSMDESTGVMTQITSKSGWFYTAVYGGQLYVIGVEDLGTDAFKVYSISTAGVWTEVFTENANYSINGLFAEYDNYQTYSVLAAFNATAYTGSAVSGRNILGYMSVIDSFTDSGTDFYLRAVYNRALGNCDSLSITVNDRYHGRYVAVSSVDFTWRPQFHKYGSKYYVLYRDLGGQLRIISIADIASCTTQFTRIAYNKFLINTLDVYNVLDCEAEVVLPSGIDYNGAVLRDDTANYDETTKIVNDVYETEYNATEKGRPPKENEMMPGYKDQQLVYTTLTKRIYAADGNLLETNKFNDEQYMNDNSYIAIDAAAKIQNGFIFVDNEIYPSAFTKNNIVGRVMNYLIVDQIGQNFQSADFFFLFGNYYVYDGSTVWLLDIFNQDAQKVAAAEGLVFITFSQEAAFFFSLSTNDLYSFSGGRLVEQVTEMHEFFTVDPTKPITGDFLASDNLLVLSKDSKVALIYNGKISRYDDTTGVAYARAGGVYYQKSTGIDAIAIHKLTSSYSAVSYLWKSAFFKIPGMISNVSEVNIYIYSSTKAAGTLTAYFYSFDETMTASVQTVTRSIVAGDYDTDGYFLGKFTPNPAMVYGFAVGCLVPFSAQVISVDAAVDADHPCTISAANTLQ